MEPRTYDVLELEKVLEILSGYAAFSLSKENIRTLEPTPELQEAIYRQQRTTEARLLVQLHPNATIGGARDVRSDAETAERGGILDASQLLTIRGTLQAAVALKKTIKEVAEKVPLLSQTSNWLMESHQLIAAIGRAIDDSGLVKDSASPYLAEVRREIRVQEGRLQSRLQSIINDPNLSSYLQENIITTRNGRYVIPIKASAHGRVKGIVHDQSASGQTLFLEPMALVEIGNQIKELQLEEDKEIRRILAELSEKVGDEAGAVIETVETLADIDVCFAMGNYAVEIDGVSPELVGFDPGQVGGTIKLYDARHPLLDPATVVPTTVELDQDVHTLIITGPNTGGKTVSMKTVGLMTLMAQCGMHIPASEESVLTVFETIYADIGDEQSIEQSLSTFSAHLTNIIGILRDVDNHSLVLLDELGSGTDPAEGAAVARAIMQELLRRGVTTMVATHYPELKIYAHNTPGIRNASVEFDVETLSPTYRLIMGIPGRSNALAIAKRLGLPQNIIDEAKTYVGSEELQVEALLDEINRMRRQAEATQERLAEAEREVDELQSELQEQLVNIERDRRKIIERTREKAGAELSELRQEVADLRRRLSRMNQPAEEDNAIALDDIVEQAETLEEQIEEPIPALVATVPQPKPKRRASQRALSIGDQVFVASMNSEGEITAIDGGADVEVQVGQFRVRVDADDLEYRGAKPSIPPRSAEISVKRPKVESPGLELHLRGKYVEDAIAELEVYIDRAYVAGLPFVRVVHGKGSGVLRRNVRDYLRRLNFIEDYGPAPRNEGGDGVTIVRFAPIA